MNEPGYFDDLREAAKNIRESPFDAVLVFHDDADGLCAGAIASLALERLGVKHKLICIEKLSAEVVKQKRERRVEKACHRVKYPFKNV